MMQKDDFLNKFVDALRKRGFKVDYLFSYNGKIKIGFFNNLLLIVDFRLDRGLPYYKVINDVGYQYRYYETAENISEVTNNIIQLIHPYANILKSIGQNLFTSHSFHFNLEEVGDIFPFLSYEEKGDQSELLIRFTNKCNQRCEFCSAPIDYIDPDIEILKRLTNNLCQHKRFQITLTGGEPTIRKEFSNFVNWLIKTTDSRLVQIQTNAVAFSDISFLSKLSRTKRIQFFVSLHSLDEDIYNIITSSKGQFPKAIKGIKNIIDANYWAVANVVITKYNYDNMDVYLEKFYDLFKNKLALHFSVLILPEYRKNLEKYIVSYKEVIKCILPLMKRYKIPIDSLISSTHASIPLCYFPQGMVKSVKRKYETNPLESGYEDMTKRWVKAKKCKRCKYDRACLGVPSLYYKIEGL